MGEFELKYIYGDMAAPALEAWLKFHTSPDKEFPAARVHTVYFDTPCLRSVAEKRNSDYFKTKYRIRWYEPLAIRAQRQEEVPLFYEIKKKIGSQRVKSRMSASVQLQPLHRCSLDSSYYAQLAEQLVENAGGEVVAPVPLIHISYIRKRFREVVNGVRLSLDHDICVEKTNLLWLRPGLRQKLSHGVFEVKGNEDLPPQSLEFLTTYCVKKCAFSKFERCVSLVME